MSRYLGKNPCPSVGGVIIIQRGDDYYLISAVFIFLFVICVDVTYVPSFLSLHYSYRNNFQKLVKKLWKQQNFSQKPNKPSNGALLSKLIKIQRAKILALWLVASPKGGNPIGWLLFIPFSNYFHCLCSAAPWLYLFHWLFRVAGDYKFVLCWNCYNFIV